MRYINFLVFADLYKKMSSTLYARGTTTQIGAMHRAVKVDREIAELRSLMEEVRAVPALVADLRKSMDQLASRLDALNIPKMGEPVSMDHIDDLDSKIEALKILQSSQASNSGLQALERRMDGKLAAALKRINGLSSTETA